MTRGIRPVFFLALLLLAAVPRAECAPRKTPPAAEKTPLSAEEIVAQLDALFDEDENGEVVVSSARFAAILKRKIARLDDLAADFRKRFPDHPLRWKVLLSEALNLPLRAEAGLTVPAGKSASAMFEQILAAPDATKEVKSEASTERLMLGAEDVGEKKLPLDDWEKWLDQHWKDFPAAGDNATIEELHIALVEESAPSRLDALLATLAKSTDAAISATAREKQAALKAIAELKGKPLDLKFKALDGADIDLGKLRGKVVLVDFWATWCGPCMAEMPRVVSAFEKLHAKGFEIVGISLDEDEAALKRVIKSKKIAWPQFFDGRGWENEIAHRFHIAGIPAMWLINKDGMIVDTDAAGQLEEKITKLLEAR